MASKPIINIEVKNSKITCCENASLDYDQTDGKLKFKKRFFSSCCQCLPQKTREKEMQKDDCYLETKQIQES